MRHDDDQRDDSRDEDGDDARDDSGDRDDSGGDSRGEDERPPADESDIDRMDDVDTSVPEENLVDRDKIDFDPDEGLLSGTAVRGGTEIPGEHQMVDDNPEVGEGEDETTTSEKEEDDDDA